MIFTTLSGWMNQSKLATHPRSDLPLQKSLSQTLARAACQFFTNILSRHLDSSVRRRLSETTRHCGSFAAAADEFHASKVSLTKAERESEASADSLDDGDGDGDGDGGKHLLTSANICSQPSSSIEGNLLALRAFSFHRHN